MGSARSWATLITSKLIFDILDYCHRRDFPHALIYTCVDLTRKQLDVSGEAAVDSSAEIYSRHDFTRSPAAIVFGSEANGVSDEILVAAKKIFIPMCGRAESLDVATSAAIILSEAVRQLGSVEKF
ncbi:MAG: hypothetical protein SR2Q5_08890 [Quinella sp. 2Q5]|nr:hypothetical protein [Quinella sp. 2Q5]